MLREEKTKMEQELQQTQAKVATSYYWKKLVELFMRLLFSYSQKFVVTYKLHKFHLNFEP